MPDEGVAAGRAAARQAGGERRGVGGSERDPGGARRARAGGARKSIEAERPPAAPRNVEARRAREPYARRPRNPVEEEAMERDEALHDYARRVASGHAYRPGEHPEDGKDVAF